VVAILSGAFPGRGVLFITSNRIGDAVLSSGVLAHLRDAYPTAPITVACGALPAPLFADLPGLERLLVMVRGGRGRHWLDLWRACRGRRWAAVADLRGSLIAWMLRAERRLVCRADKRHEHRVEELARQLALPAPPAPRLWVSQARSRLAAGRLGGGAPVLAVGPTANWGAKQWPPERFAQAVTRLTAAGGVLAGGRVAVFGAAAERPVAQPVLDAVAADRRLDFVGDPSLLDVYAVLTHCSFYLGNDSGLMHMAAAAGIPTLGLFGPSPEWRHRPWGPRTAVVRTPESYDTLINDASFDHRKQDTLMGNLTVDAVIAAAERLSEQVGLNGGNGAFR
jgi:ADP-heptose:LPS heptosyltransferase